ncbi:MAG: hypothetical protein LBL26_04135 [Peptococcaceae bacterium]|jgi:hypothetical protein|nr:hypothetical protein [Peptococcaceae bacterium]
MTAESLQKERIQNLIDAASFKEPKKIPVGAEILSWPFSYAGVKYSDVMDDAAKTARAYVKFLDDIELDFLWGGMVTTAVKALKAMDCNCFDLGNDGTTIIHRQPEVEFMTTEEYPELIADMNAFKQKLIRRRCKALQLPQEQAYECVLRALREIRPWVEANAMIDKYIFGEKGVAPLTGGPILFLGPLTVLFDKFRGIRDTLIDLRRRPETVRQACDVILDDRKNILSAFDPKDFSYPHPFASTVYHVECFLSPAQFDEYYFRHFKEVCLPYMEAGAKFFLKGEGSFIHTLDRFRQLPKGSVVFMLDEDDPFEVYKAIGDWQTVATGITADLLKMGSKEECVDFVKRSFDTFAPGGGFIFMQNKPLLCANDAKAENILAVYETANELSLKR